MLISLRVPDVLQARIDQAAGDGKRSEWILEACRMRLDGGRSSEAEHSGNARDSSQSQALEVVGRSIRSAPTKPDMQALRDICAGNPGWIVATSDTQKLDDGTYLHTVKCEDLQPAETPICGKDWWEDGEHYECLMDKDHREALVGKHGLRGMVRRLDA